MLPRSLNELWFALALSLIYRSLQKLGPQVEEQKIAATF